MASSDVGGAAEPSSDVHGLAHRIVAEFLQRQGYTSTLESFQGEASSWGWQWPSKGGESNVRIESLVEAHESLRRAAERRALAGHGRKEGRTPLDLNLPGPSSIRHEVIKVHGSLHPGNILSLSVVRLPLRYFSTALAQYVREERLVLCSTGADKNVTFSDPQSGELVDCYEGGTGRGDEMKHAAAVLCTAQNPGEMRELVSCGMDSKVIVWDMLHGKPIQELRDHSRFVVRCAFSSTGQYLATCSYDRSVRIYKRLAGEADGADADEEEMPPLLTTRFELAHTVTTGTNPESIVFIRSRAHPDPSDPGEGELQTSDALPQSAVGRADATVTEERTWLAYTVRNDCFIHYVALPVDADRHGRCTDDVIDGLDRLQIGQRTADWADLAFNTNESRSDLHVSYSLLHLTIHPLHGYLAIQTGDHSIPTTGYAPSSSALSRILIMPFLSSKRLTTIWTGVASSGFATNRHAWLPDGSAAWLTSEDGILRLVDTHSKVRATVHAHGAAAAAESGEDSQDHQLARTATWSRGGNTVIKDVVVLSDDGTVASCGFDRTIRIVAPS